MFQNQKSAQILAGRWEAKHLILLNEEIEMSTNKLMALIGNILFTLNNVLSIVFIPILLFILNRSVSYSDGYYNNLNTDPVANNINHLLLQILPIIFMIALLIVIVENIFTWIAFAKMEGGHGRGWRIFLLIIGILHVFSFFSGVFFILAFALKDSQHQKEKASMD